MATIKKITVPPAPVEPEINYVLTLSNEEAKALRSLLGTLPGNIVSEGSDLYAIWSSLYFNGVAIDEKVVAQVHDYTYKVRTKNG